MRGSAVLACSAFAFAAGFAAAHWLPNARAADEVIAPQIINVMTLADSDLAPPPLSGDFRSKTFVVADGVTIAVQTGNVARHMHPNTNEIQYIVEGTGKFWLGDTEREVKPGDLIVIPKGVAHSGTVPVSGKFKSIAIKTPPQKPGDTKMLP
jgi:mannose-6-phosphate isomerase-like protein (cupin superfamily)